jgi:hypothetical protein
MRCWSSWYCVSQKAVLSILYLEETHRAAERCPSFRWCCQPREEVLSPVDLVPSDLTTENDRYVPWAMFICSAGIEWLASHRRVGISRDAVWIGCLKAEVGAEEAMHMA